MSDAPAQASSQAPTSASPPGFDIAEVAQPPRPWRLTLYPGHLSLQPPEETQPFIYLRSDFFDKLEFIAGLRLLALRLPRKLNFKLPKEAVAPFEQWFGVPDRRQLGLLLHRRYALAVPVAILFILASLPMGGEAVAPDKRSPFDPLTFSLGCSLVGLWAGARFRPHPSLFLLDSLWFLALAAGQIVLILRGQHWWWSIWTLLLVWMSYSGFQRFRQFRK